MFAYFLTYQRKALKVKRNVYKKLWQMTQLLSAVGEKEAIYLYWQLWIAMNAYQKPLVAMVSCGQLGSAMGSYGEL